MRGLRADALGAGEIATAPLVARVLIAAAWLAAAYVLRKQFWPRWLLSTAGVVFASFYLGPLWVAELERALFFPNPREPQVPFLGYFVGLVLGPLTALLLGYFGTKRAWCYILNQAITCAFLFWMRFGILDD